MKSTLVKIFLVLNLILCAGVLAFSFVTFRDRELVKARNAILRENLGALASNIRHGEEVAGEDPELRAAGQLRLQAAESVNELPDLQAALTGLKNVAAARLDQLSGDYGELQEVTDELVVARDELAKTTRELNETRESVSSLESSIADARERIQQAQGEDTRLQREISTLTQTKENLESRAEEKEARESQLTNLLEIRTGERDRIEDLLAAARRPLDRDGSVEDWVERTGRILAVEPEWNYVVIDKGEVDVLPLFIEAFVHRGDDFIAKIRVMQVEQKVALAEVIEGTLAEGAQLETGDTIFF